MRRENWFLLCLIIIIFVLILWRPEVSWKFQSIILNRLTSPPDDLNKLQGENIRLKAELAELQDFKSQRSTSSPSSIVVSVYSRYPLNFKDEILIDAGISDSLDKDQPAFFEDFLIGRIVRVFDEASVVRTVFDHRWQSAVRIGPQGVEALVTGGTRPRLTLIDRKARVEPGMAVYNAAPLFPYAAPIAEVKEVAVSADQFWQEAELTFPYEINKVRALTIIRTNVGFLE